METRLRAVLLDEKGGVAYRTVGPESPWGIKRPPARVVPVFCKLNKTPRKTNRDRHSMQENLKNPLREKITQATKEAAEVEKFIRNAVSPRGTSSAMYISGVPGTGKTATVVSVVKQLSQDKTCNKFSFVCVNAMEFVEPKKIFIAIYNQITDNVKRISAESARRKLNRMFELSDKHRPPIVILVDELDQLCTKKQEVIRLSRLGVIFINGPLRVIVNAFFQLIYDIFNWTTIESARVSVMAIANTLDLPERMLSQRITSRIGAARICFQPYEFQQIECIIRDRLKGSVNAIDEGAVQFAARKVAAVTGDLRKAMDLLRRAIEIAIEQGSKKLLVEHAEKREDFSFAELHAQYLSFATSLEGIQPLVESVLISLIGQLCSTKLLVQSSGNHMLRRRIRLGMSYQDAQSAIRIRENANKDN
ncbi:ATPase, AAA family [Ostertagia ostertagi]